MTTDERVGDERAKEAGPDALDTLDTLDTLNTLGERAAVTVAASSPRDGAHRVSPWPMAAPPIRTGAEAAPTVSASHPTSATFAALFTVPWYERPWVIRAGMALLIALYIFGWGLSAFYTVNPTDIEVFFVPDARLALAKGFLYIYQLRVGDIYPNANGPLSMGPFTLAAAIAQSQGWLGNVYLRRMVIFAVFAPFPLLVGWEAVRVTDRLFATPLQGLARIIAYGVFALTPELWHSALFYGHMEQPMEVWFLLAGARALGERRVARGGALLGLALLTRSVASVACLPLALLLLREALATSGFRWRRWGHDERMANLLALGRASLTLVRFGAALAGTILLVLAPFLLVDRQDVIFSLVTFRSALPVGGGNIWGLALTSRWQGIALRYDSVIALCAALLLSLLVLAVRRDLTLRSPDLYGLLTLTCLCFPLLTKMFWPYYLLETYFFAAVWVLVSLPTERATLARVFPARGVSNGALAFWGVGWALPVGVIIAASLAEYGLSSNSYGGWTTPWPLVLTICFLTLMGFSLVWLIWGGAIWRAALWRILGEEPDESASPPAGASTPTHLAPSPTTFAYTEQDQSPLKKTSIPNDIQPI